MVFKEHRALLIHPFYALQAGGTCGDLDLGIENKSLSVF